MPFTSNKFDEEAAITGESQRELQDLSLRRERKKSLREHRTNMINEMAGNSRYMSLIIMACNNDLFTKYKFHS